MSLPEGTISVLLQAQQQQRTTKIIIVLVVILLVIVIIAVIIYLGIYAKEHNLDINPFDTQMATVVQAS